MEITKQLAVFLDNRPGTLSRVCVALAEAKGLDQDEIGYGLIAATAEHMLARGEPECCVMQILMDYTASFYVWWHDGLSEDAKDEEEN